MSLPPVNTAGGERFGVFDFGLSAEQETRAARLHQDSIIVDMLFQGPCGYRSFTPAILEIAKQSARDDTPLEQYFATVFAPVRAALRGDFPEFRECWEQSGITGGNRQVGYGPPAYAIAEAQFETFPWMIKAVKAADFRKAKANGQRAGFLSTQDVEQDLQTAYEAGLRMMGLSYNVQNSVAGGILDVVDSGVTALGAEVIRQMDALGILIDVSHSSQRAALDACRLSQNPIVISHASAAALCTVPRAKSDEVIRAIATSGGVFGVAAVPEFLAAGKSVTIEALLDHIDYIARLVGWQHVAIGTDWPLQIDLKTQREAFPAVLQAYGAVANGPPSLIGFGDYRDFPNITRGLVRRGYGDEEIRGILGENFLRVFETVCG